MKKFLKKLPVMITFSVITVLFAALMIGLLARPVSYGMTYSGTINWSEEAGEETTLFHVTLKLKNDRKAVLSQWVDGGEEHDSNEVTIIRDGKNIYIVGSGNMSDKEYEVITELFNKTKELFLDRYGDKESLITINAYNANYMGAKLVAKGTVAMTIVFTVIEAVLVAFTALSISSFVGATKKSGTKKKRK